MNNFLLDDAISCIDGELIEMHLKKRNALRKKKVKNKAPIWMKWSSIAVACCVMLILATFIIQYIPVSYNLDYSYTGSNGEDTYILDENVWIYYVDGSNIKRERVSLPCTAENVFITWKHLNDIGDDIVFVSCKIESNGMESGSSFDGENVDNYKQGDYFVLNILITGNLKDYAKDENYSKLIESLKRSMTEYSNINFDEVNIQFE